MVGNGAVTLTWIAPVAPDEQPLAWLTEIGEIGAIDGVKLKIVAGPKVSRAQIAQALRSRHDVTVWSGHGAPGGLAMPDGSFVQPKWLATQSRCGIPRVMILAACGSQLRDEHLKSMVEEISRQGLNGVGFPAHTEDPAAITFTTELVRAFVAGASVGVAFDVAMESIAETETARGVFLVPGLSNGYRDVVLRLEALEAGQHELRDGLNLIMGHLGIERPASRKAAVAGCD
jgi:hypothetical protein